MDWRELEDPELADAHEVLQAFEEQALGPVNSFTDLSELPPPSDLNHLGRFLPDSHDGPVDPTEGEHGSGEPTLGVVQPALKSQPILRPPSPANPSLDVGVVPFKRSRDIKSDLLILRVAASVPLTSRLNIDWRAVHEKLQGTALGEWPSERVARAFHSLIRRVDSGQPPWTVDTSPAEVEEGLQLITKLKCTANVGLPSEKVPLLRLPLQRYNLQHKVRRPPRKMSYLPTETAPRRARPITINSLQIRPLQVDEELTQRSRNIEGYITGKIRFIPNLGSWRTKYIPSEQLQAMEVLTEMEGDVAAAAAQLGMEEDDLEAQLDEWILERKRQREEELGGAQESEQQEHYAPSELSSN